MRKIFYSFIVCLLSTVAVQAQTIEGDWEGKLSAGGAELRLVFHVKKDDKGGFQATLDSVDQGAMGIPASSASFKDGVLKITIDVAQAGYEGKLDASRNVVTGTWSQGAGSLPLELTRPKPRAAEKPRTPKPSDIDGDWEGALEAGGQTLRVVLHITTFEDGMSGKFDSLDQNISGAPVTTIQRNGTKLKFEMRQFAGAFEGTIDKELKTISGEWSQGPVNLPLVFKRKSAPTGK